MNISYSDKEDRLLLRTSTRAGAEYRIWLTRRFTCLLLHVLGSEMQEQGALLTVTPSRKARSRAGTEANTGAGTASAASSASSAREQAGVFSRPFEEEKTSNFPLGEAGILAHSIQSRKQGNGSVFLQIHSEAGFNLGLDLSEDLLYMFHSLILQGTESADWNIPTAPTQPSTQIH